MRQDNTEHASVTADLWRRTEVSPAPHALPSVALSNHRCFGVSVGARRWWPQGKAGRLANLRIRSSESALERLVQCLEHGGAVVGLAPGAYSDPAPFLRERNSEISTEIPIRLLELLFSRLQRSHRNFDSRTNGSRGLNRGAMARWLVRWAGATAPQTLPTAPHGLPS